MVERDPAAHFDQPPPFSTNVSADLSETGAVQLPPEPDPDVR